jgi:hypothetical protein
LVGKNTLGATQVKLVGLPKSNGIGLLGNQVDLHSWPDLSRISEAGFVDYSICSEIGLEVVLQASCNEETHRPDHFLRDLGIPNGYD